MSEEEKATLEFIKINNKHRYCDKNDVDFLLNLIEKQQKELDNLKEIEKTHQEENGLLRQELDMQIEHNKELEATLKQTQDSWFEDTQKLEQEKEKNRELEKNNIDLKEKNRLTAENLSRSYISKDKIKEKLAELENKSGGNSYHVQAMINAEKNILKELLEEK